MTDITDIETRRKRLRFRCWHRGSREADLLLGRFADRHLDWFSVEQLTRLETLLDQEDPDIWAWAVGRTPVPPAFDHDVMALLRGKPAAVGDSG